MASELLERFVFAIAESYDQKAGLKKVVRDADQSIQTIQDLNPEALYAAGIRAVVFDFDGVLAAQDHLTLSEKVLAQLSAFCNRFGQSNIVIWSNNPIPARMRFIAEHFKNVEWLDGERKPHPAALKRLIQSRSYGAETVLLVDDRLLTGILAGILSGCQVRLVKKPCIVWRGNLKREGGFALLRAFEQFIFRYIP